MTEPTFIDLEGEGPFELEFIESVDVSIGDIMAVLKLTTLRNNLVIVPLGMQALEDLHRLSGEALAQVQASDADTVQ